MVQYCIEEVDFSTCYLVCTQVKFEGLFVLSVTLVMTAAADLRYVI